VSKILDFFRGKGASPDRASDLYHKAISETDHFIEQLREESGQSEPVRELVADIWQYRRNVPVITTLYEANQEMMSAVKQR
jgi:hypothetical protein